MTAQTRPSLDLVIDAPGRRPKRRHVVVFKAANDRWVVWLKPPNDRPVKLGIVVGDRLCNCRRPHRFRAIEARDERDYNRIFALWKFTPHDGKDVYRATSEALRWIGLYCRSLTRAVEALARDEITLATREYLRLR